MTFNLTAPGDISNPPSSGGGGGGSSLVASDVLTIAGAVMTVSGLDLDTDGAYEIEYLIVGDNSPGTPSVVFVTLNADTTQTGYYRTGSANSSYILPSANYSENNIRVGNMELLYGRNKVGESIPAIFNKVYSTTPNFSDIYKNMGSGTNITALAVRSTNVNFAVGSYIKVYRKH